jgi:hypothetical protein
MSQAVLLGRCTGMGCLDVSIASNMGCVGLTKVYLHVHQERAGTLLPPDPYPYTPPYCCREVRDKSRRLCQLVCDPSCWLHAERVYLCDPGCRAQASAPAAAKPTPVVRIDNLSDPFATVVSVEYGDRVGELLETVRIPLWRGVRWCLPCASCLADLQPTPFFLIIITVYPVTVHAFPTNTCTGTCRSQH